MIIHCLDLRYFFFFFFFFSVLTNLFWFFSFYLHSTTTATTSSIPQPQPASHDGPRSTWKGRRWDNQRGREDRQEWWWEWWWGSKCTQVCFFFTFLILLTIIYKDYVYDTTTAAPRPGLPTPSSLYFMTATWPAMTQVTQPDDCQGQSQDKDKGPNDETMFHHLPVCPKLKTRWRRVLSPM